MEFSSVVLAALTTRAVHAVPRNQNQQQNGPPWMAGANKDREEEEGSGYGPDIA
jgi:hypothetical protein